MRISTQAKIAEVQRQSVKKIGVALQALHSLNNFRDDGNNGDLNVEDDEEEKSEENEIGFKE